VTPVATTDYLANSAIDGSGSNLTANLTVTTWTPGTEGFTAVLTNGSASTMYVTRFSPRAIGIYLYNPIDHTATNAASIAEFEAQSMTLHQKYQNTTYTGRVFVDSKVDEYHEPRIVLKSVTFTANKSENAMNAFLFTDIGDLRHIEITELGIEGNYYVQGIEVNMKGSIIVVKWIVAVALSLLTDCGLSPLAVEFAGGAATDAITFNTPRVNNLSQRTYTAWIYLDAAPAASILVMGNSGDLAGAALYVTTDRKLQYYEKTKTGSTLYTGIWQTPLNSVPTGAWTLVTATRDAVDLPDEPTVYINGTLQTLTNTSASGDELRNETNTPLLIGNVHSTFDRAFDGKIKDARVYNLILSSTEVTALYNSGTPDMSLVTDGLVFQAFAVRDEDLAAYTDATLTSTMLLRENVFGAVGEPHGSPIGRAP
jgi:hypothetical protein